MENAPIYLILGFLESGKTRFIKELLTDEQFSAGERTVLIVCEDGEEEYESALLKKSNTQMVMLEEASELTASKLTEIEKQFEPERVIIEYNSVWTVDKLFAIKKPKRWELAQIVTLVDSTTFDMYMTNMRQMMADGLNKGDAVIFNRCDENTKKSAYRRTVRAMNPSAQIIFDNVDGTSDDGVADEDLPYDVNADIVQINDDQFGIWYLDAMDHPDRYDQKTLRVKGKLFKMDGLPTNCYVFGRNAMTCCANDIGGIGFLCKYDGVKPAENMWIQLTCKAEASFSPIHNRDAIILIQKKFGEAQPPKEDLVTFN